MYIINVNVCNVMFSSTADPTPYPASFPRWAGASFFVGPPWRGEAADHRRRSFGLISHDLSKVMANLGNPVFFHLNWFYRCVCVYIQCIIAHSM